MTVGFRHMLLRSTVTAVDFLYIILFAPRATLSIDHVLIKMIHCITPSPSPSLPPSVSLSCTHTHMLNDSKNVQYENCTTQP